MKNSFVMYTDWTDMVKALDNESRGELLLAIMAYQSGEEINDLDPCAQVAFACMRTQFDKDTDKYEESMRKRSEAGKVAAQARINASKSNDSQATVTNRNESLHDNVSVNDSDLKENHLKVVKEKRFQPPTVEEVEEYCKQKGYAMDAEMFVDYYSSKGWMVGKNKMVNWHSAVGGWYKRQKEHASPQKKNRGFDDFQQREYDFAAMNKQMFGGGTNANASYDTG